MVYGRLEPLEHYIRVVHLERDNADLYELSCRLCPEQGITADAGNAAIVATLHARYHRDNPIRGNPQEGANDHAST